MAVRNRNRCSGRQLQSCRVGEEGCTRFHAPPHLTRRCSGSIARRSVFPAADASSMHCTSCSAEYGGRVCIGCNRSRPVPPRNAAQDFSHTSLPPRPPPLGASSSSEDATELCCNCEYSLLNAANSCIGSRPASAPTPEPSLSEPISKAGALYSEGWPVACMEDESCCLELGAVRWAIERVSRAKRNRGCSHSFSTARDHAIRMTLHCTYTHTHARLSPMCLRSLRSCKSSECAPNLPAT